MEEKDYILFMELLEKFINECGLDAIDACHKAIKIINEQ